MKYEDAKSASKNMNKNTMDPSTNPNAPNSISRRHFIYTAGIGAIAMGLQQIGCSVSKKPIQQSLVNPPIQGFERTSCFREDLYAMRTIYESGGFGKLVYSEGEYFHYMSEPIASYKDWRVGLPPQWYPTHSNAYYIGVTGGSFTEVSCLGMPSIVSHLQAVNNRYKNPFGTEIAMFRTSEGGTARMGVSWDTPGDSGERGRVRGQKGSFYGKYEGLEKTLPNLNRPSLPPGVPPGGHGGSHGYLMNEFVTAILQDRKPLVDIAVALNMTVAGIIAHQSALKEGELMKIPQYSF